MLPDLLVERVRNNLLHGLPPVRKAPSTFDTCSTVVLLASIHCQLYLFHCVTDSDKKRNNECDFRLFQCVDDSLIDDLHLHVFAGIATLGV